MCDRSNWKTYNSLYVSKASFAVISSLRNFRLGVVPSSKGGSYSLDHGDLEKCVNRTHLYYKKEDVVGMMDARGLHDERRDAIKDTHR